MSRGAARRLARGDRRHRAGWLPLRDAARRAGPGRPDRRRRHPDRRRPARELRRPQVHQLRVFAALLCAWTVAALLVNLLLPALFALGRTKLVNGLAPVVVVVHVARHRPRRRPLRRQRRGRRLLRRPDSPSPPSCWSPAPAAARRRSPASWAATASASHGLAALSFGIGAAIADSLFRAGSPAPRGRNRRLLYGLTTSQLAPRQIRLLVGAVRPASAEASSAWPTSGRSNQPTALGSRANDPPGERPEHASPRA